MHILRTVQNNSLQEVALINSLRSKSSGINSFQILVENTLEKGRKNFLEFMFKLTFVYKKDAVTCVSKRI